MKCPTTVFRLSWSERARYRTSRKSEVRRIGHDRVQIQETVLRFRRFDVFAGISTSDARNSCTISRAERAKSQGCLKHGHRRLRLVTPKLRLSCYLHWASGCIRCAQQGSVHERGLVWNSDRIMTTVELTGQE